MVVPFAFLFFLEFVPPTEAFAPHGGVNPQTATPSSSQLRMATWSDSKAVKEYQDFLSSGAQEVVLKDDCPSVILVSPNEADLEFNELNPLAQALMHMGNGDDVILSPYQTLPEVLGEGEYASSEYPIYITLPPQEIEPFLDNLDEVYSNRQTDFSFFAGGFQYGNIEELLQPRGYCRDAMTQIVISGMELGADGIKDLAVSLGNDSVGEEKWAGECAACGKWNGAIAKRLERNEIRCTTDFYRDWRRKMWERNCLDAVMNLVGCVRAEPTTLADVANYYEEEVSDILWEMTGTLRGWKAITLMFGFEERMFGFAERQNSQQCAVVDEWFPYIWGNKVFIESSKYLEYLHYAKSEMGLFQTVELPPMKEDSELALSKMRKGNLRADGVV
mmetsp:Transcript_30072/g.64443  ORF Transcript_30072/g.64443 Transcript_30072/m.64443 type:complete len:389 (-) Transcript_30072:164-1330(-)|eukprot:CAMPEP_0201129144 /NCGR_PEP_ID=MMETSP0850-20130426/35979_1 /ASSEMBLY_ACC=CAM_ASM_000622 /TAXON_ID=183588 /ORGANISM="Pseudo-nitzschia fraudulenta, Strain WWA7" /LENGTH=388 /DNA_ID=CAMNT_0047398539 /DNA_START=45 /DNA_END=1211 /DNA_ORIENTATION=+